MKRIAFCIAWMLIIYQLLYPGTVEATAINNHDIPAEEDTAAAHDERHLIRLEVAVSPDAKLRTTLDVESAKVAKELRKLPSTGIKNPYFASDSYVTVEMKGVKRTWAYDRKNAMLVDTLQGDTVALSPRLEGWFSFLFEALRSTHYGVKVSWKDARNIVPRKSYFTVLDLETGIEFRVQRRAGSSHADVQPVTKADTALMKQIYEGKWSWNRKAILVRKDGYTLAASMHGMPHGGDGIPGNNFSGHFCIHFQDSTTHRSGKVDFPHQLMIHKAAGLFDEKLAEATPQEIVDTFLIALQHHEKQWIRALFDGASPHAVQSDYFAGNMMTITSVHKIDKDPKITNTEEQTELQLPVRVKVFREGSGEDVATYEFHLKKDGVTKGWKIHYISILSKRGGARKR